MHAEPRKIRFVADRGDARLRLDQVLVRRVAEVSRMSRTRAQAWIEAGAVSVDGVAAARASTAVREGALVELTVPADTAFRQRPSAEAGALDILYEGDGLIALNKPAGVVVHPSYKHGSGTLLNALLWHLRDRPGSGPGFVTRLDKHTSGVLLVALSGEMHAALQRAAAAGKLRKEYLAVVQGVPAPGRGEIDLPLGRDESDRRRVIVRADGAPSTTRYEVLESGQGLSLVRCELVTGRMHQIRVHLSARGWPILGDAAYGVPHAALARQALHAWRVHLTHPASGAELELTAPLPDDIRALGLGSRLRA